ncbi:MAG: hypothetical protein LC777_03565, partial [Actinobacteria bacterium]|nr:hypothetical protein [Actinomycetota bacterium]
PPHHPSAAVIADQREIPMSLSPRDLVDRDLKRAWLLQNEWRVPANPGFLMAERPFERGLNLGISR